MSRSAGWIGIIVGIILILLALFGSSLGFGGPAFGLKHIVALVVGIVVLAAGLYVALWMKQATS